MAAHEKRVVTKYPFKRLCFSLHSSTAAIPHQIDLLKQHNCRIQEHKQTKNWDLLHREQVNACNVIKQLKQIVHELEKMKHQVIDEDYSLLEREIEPIKNMIAEELNSFIAENGEVNEVFDNSLNEMEKSLNLPSSVFRTPFPSSFFKDDSDNSNEWQVLSFDRENKDNESHVNNENDGVSNIKLTELETAEINKRLTVLNTWEVLRSELLSLNATVNSLSSIVNIQKSKVDNIEMHVEKTEAKISEGVRETQKGAIAKAATFPITGALCGGAIGGPVGFVLGLKLGATAAAVGGVIGYFGGKLLQKRTKTSDELEMSTYNSSEEATEDKKNI